MGDAITCTIIVALTPSGWLALYPVITTGKSPPEDQRCALNAPLSATVPSPKLHLLEVTSPVNSALNCTSNPEATLLNDALTVTLSSSVDASPWYSSQPIDGGLSQGSLSMSRPTM